MSAIRRKFKKRKDKENYISKIAFETFAFIPPPKKNRRKDLKFRGRGKSILFYK